MSASTETATFRGAPGVRRAAAIGAFAFVGLVIAQNLVRSAEPGFGAAVPEVTRYFADHRAAVVVPLCLFPLEMVALLVFVAGMRALARVSPDDQHARFWADLGTLAVLVIAALFAVVNVAEVAILAIVDGSAAAPQSVAAIWAVHAGAFGLNLGAIAVALVALSRLARRLRLIPAWLATLAVPGGLLLFAAATSTIWVAEGGAMLFVGLAGFVVWALFLFGCGLGLLRHEQPVAPAVEGPRSMNTVIHAAFRRDLRRFDEALAGFPAGSQPRADDLHRAWQHYADQLHRHHEGEEQIFFPALAQVADVATLVDDLEAEHAGLLAALASAGSAMDGLRADPSAARARTARDALGVFADVLDAHLAHEERDFEPLAAEHAGSAPMQAAEREIRERHRTDSGTFFAWLLDGASPAEAAALRRLIPPPALRAATLVGGRSYRATVAGVWP